MAHGTRIGGTNMDVTAGFTKVNGVNRTITKGLTLVGGVQRDIIIIPKEMVTMTLSNTSNSQYQRVTVDGTEYKTAGSYEIEKGSTVQISVMASNTSYCGVVRLNRTVVLQEYTTSWVTYELVADEDFSLTFNGSSHRGYVDITK